MHGYLRFEPGAWKWNEGLPCSCADCKKLISLILFKFSHSILDWTVLSWNLGGILETFLEGSADLIIYRDYIVNRRFFFIYCSLACGLSWLVSLPLKTPFTAGVRYPKTENTAFAFSPYLHAHPPRVRTVLEWTRQIDGRERLIQNKRHPLDETPGKLATAHSSLAQKSDL